MKNLNNNVRLLGHIGQQPEIKDINGKKLAKFSLATIHWRKDETGKRVSEIQWYHAIAWGTQAALVERDLAKGTEVAIEGTLHTRTYKDSKGANRHFTEIVVLHFHKPERKMQTQAQLAA